MDAGKIIEIIYSAVADLNHMLPTGNRLPVGEELKSISIYGPEGKLDSLGLINLISILEERIADELSTEVNLVNEEVASNDFDPFRSVTTLAEYVGSVVNNEG